MEYLGEEEEDTDGSGNGKDINPRLALTAVEEDDAEDDYRSEDVTDVDDKCNIDAKKSNKQNCGLFLAPVELNYLFFFKDKALNNKCDREDKYYDEADAGYNTGAGCAGVKTGKLDLRRHYKQAYCTEQAHDNAGH